MRVCLFEDAGHATLEPLSATRPVFDLLCGLTALKHKQIRHFGSGDLGVLIRPHLAPLYRVLHSGLAVNDVGWLRAESTVLVNGRWLPPAQPARRLSGPCVGLIGEEVAFALVELRQLAAYAVEGLEDCLKRWKRTLPRLSAGGELIAYPWQLVDRNARQIERDFEALPPRPSKRRPHVHVVGPRKRLRIHSSAKIDPLVVIDTTNGPVVIDAGAAIRAFSRLEGPCLVGPEAQVVGATLRGGVTLGPQCRIGGEVECSIVQGFTNKVHHGFLGHSYLGEWVNFGAGTSTSDLRNDYGEVNVIQEGRPTPTGLTKVGCFVGDHTKTGLGTLLNTGSHVGAFCNLLPAGGFVPKYVPAFTNWQRGELEATPTVDGLLTIAATAMRRRGVTLTAEHADLYRQLFETTEGERRRALREFQKRRLRRSA